MKRGFTLIELLIVVAIIAILAAIAVPNFLEAQIRAKAARVKADMRTVKVGLESYRIDGVQYPPAASEPGFTPLMYEDRYRYLTTPIAYLSSFPVDTYGKPFSPNNAPVWPKGDPKNPTGLFDYWTWRAASKNGTVPPFNFHTYETGYQYQIRSLGPDRQYDGTNTYATGPKKGLVVEYDPTNGTISGGDIFVWGPGN